MLHCAMFKLTHINGWARFILLFYWRKFRECSNSSMKYYDNNITIIIDFLLYPVEHFVYSALYCGGDARLHFLFAFFRPEKWVLRFMYCIEPLSGEIMSPINIVDPWSLPYEQKCLPELLSPFDLRWTASSDSGCLLEVCSRRRYPSPSRNE